MSKLDCRVAKAPRNDNVFGFNDKPSTSSLRGACVASDVAIHLLTKNKSSFSHN